MITVHEPAVVYTDLGLAALGGVFSWRLATRAGHAPVARAGAVVMGGLASAALWGAIFHAFFPAKTATRAGFMAWMPVAISIGVVASALLYLGILLLVPSLSVRMRRALVGVYAAGFALTVAFVDESFTMIVRLYGPMLVLMLVASAHQAIARRGAWAWLVAAGVATSMVAAALQQARVAVHPVYFDHNAVYHVVQGVALVLLYRGFGRAGLAPELARGASMSGAR